MAKRLSRTAYGVNESIRSSHRGNLHEAAGRRGVEDSATRSALMP
jgi:hypothetical protein